MSKLENSFVLEKLQNQFGSAILGHEESYGLMTIVASRDANLEILQFLKDDEDLAHSFLTDITAVHYPNTDHELCVVYHTHSMTKRHRLRFKFYLPTSDASIRSATPIYLGANWMEREAYDFFGVQFLGHPDLRRILNMDELEVFPMRKEYPLEDPNRVDKKDYFFGR
ncbi:MAG: NADH-quinone oxidoreductase subunit C [Cytophagales bacterium]